MLELSEAVVAVAVEVVAAAVVGVLAKCMDCAIAMCVAELCDSGDRPRLPRAR